MTVAAMDLWNQCLIELRERIRSVEIETWLRPCQIEISDDTVVFHVGNRFKAEWIIKSYMGQIIPILERLSGKKIDIKFAFTRNKKVEGNQPEEKKVELPTRLLNCEKHGEYTSEIINIGGKEMTMRCRHCVHEEKEAEQRREQAILFEHRIKQQQAQSAEMLNLLGIPALPDIQKGKGFKHFETGGNHEKESVKLKCGRYAANFSARWEEGGKKRAMGLCLQGTTGSGKGHIACSIAANVIKQGFSAQYITASEIILKARDFEKQEKVISLLSNVDLLVVDDVGIGNQTEQGLNFLFLVIDARIRKQIPTIYTTNLTPENLKQRVGDPIFSRIEGGTFPIIMPFDDYRKIERRKMEESFFG